MIYVQSNKESGKSTTQNNSVESSNPDVRVWILDINV